MMGCCGKGIVSAVAHGVKQNVKLALGIGYADARLADRRLAECKRCPSGGPRWTCAECHCPLLRKAKLADERCPLSRWPA